MVLFPLFLFLSVWGVLYNFKIILTEEWFVVIDFIEVGVAKFLIALPTSYGSHEHSEAIKDSKTCLAVFFFPACLCRRHSKEEGQLNFNK